MVKESQQDMTINRFGRQTPLTERKREALNSSFLGFNSTDDGIESAYFFGKISWVNKKPEIRVSVNESHSPRVEDLFTGEEA